MLLHIVSVCPIQCSEYVEVTATHSNIIIFLHNMRNIYTICIQYIGGKVGMELGKNGHFFPKTAPLTPVSIDTASTPPRHLRHL